MAIYSERYRVVLFVAPFAGAAPLIELMLDGMRATWTPSADVKIDHKIVTPRVGCNYAMLVAGGVIHPDDLAASYKFTVVRNTYDWLVAMYQQTRPARSAPPAPDAERLEFERRGFSEWLREQNAPLAQAGKTSTAQTAFLQNVDGVIHFDAYETGVRSLLSRLGAEHLEPLLPEYLKPVIGRDHTAYRRFYSPQDIELVQQVHAPMIERFKFTF